MTDRYIEYTHRYFRFWLPVYDMFAFSVGNVYGRCVDLARIVPGETIVDICAGTGEMTRRLAGRGAIVTGVDVTPDMLTKARRKLEGLSARLMLMDARRLAFPDGSFETAFLSLALHDMPRAVAVEVLREATRVTRRRIVVLDYSLPRHPFLHAVSRTMIEWFETVYFRRYVREGLDPLLSDAGLPNSKHTPIRGSFFAMCEISLAGYTSASREEPRRS